MAEVQRGDGWSADNLDDRGEGVAGCAGRVVGLGGPDDEDRRDRRTGAEAEGSGGDGRVVEVDLQPAYAGVGDARAERLVEQGGAEIVTVEGEDRLGAHAGNLDEPGHRRQIAPTLVAMRFDGAAEAYGRFRGG